MELHHHVASYVSLMRVTLNWFGSERSANRTFLQELLTFYTRVKWVLYLSTLVAVWVSLRYVESYGLHDGTFLFLPVNIVLVVIIINETLAGGQQEELTQHFSDVMNAHSEPWMQSIQDRYLIVFFKNVKLFLAFQAVSIFLYFAAPFVSGVVLHYGLGHSTAPTSLPGPFTNFLGKEAKWDAKYFIITFLNSWTMTDSIFTLIAALVSYLAMSIFFLTELEIFETNLKALNDIDYAVQEEVDESYRKILLTHNEIIQLNDRMKQYFGLPGAFVSVITMIFVPVLAFTAQETSQSELKLLYLMLLTKYLTSGFLYCYFGQLMENKGEDIFHATYNLRWHELSPSVRRNINMILRQSSAPLTIDFHGMFGLNLKSFEEICTNSYSYFTLLQTMTSDE